MEKYQWFLISMVFLCSPVSAASFDCHQARAPDEKTICASRELNDMDVEMSVKYHFLRGLFAMGVAGNMQDAQGAWLKKRQKCDANATCIHDLYQQRIDGLSHFYEAIHKPL